jgi:hypothetical protein
MHERNAARKWRGRKALVLLALAAFLTAVLSSCPASVFLQDIQNKVSTAQNGGGTVDDPFFNPSGSSYNEDQNVAIDDTTPGATVYYTIDGTTPSSSSTKYTGPILVQGPVATVTIAAIAVKSGMTNSHVVTATYKINYNQVIQPSFTPPADTYNHDIAVALSSTTGATIHYTIDGTPPTASSTVYASAIPIAGDGTSKRIRAYATKSGMSDSDPAQADYVINYSYNRVATPALTPPGGSYTSAQTVAISCATTGSTIRYTLDGSTPSDTAGDLYPGPILISSNKTLKAIAYKGGMANSVIASADYSFRTPITPLSFTATGADQAVNLTWSAAPGATSYKVYCAQGTFVDKSVTPIVIPGTDVSKSVLSLAVNTTYAFIITSVGDYGESDPSSIKTATTFQKLDKPSISPGDTTSNTPVSVTITATSGAYISYTTNGTTPSATGGALSPVNFTVTKSETVKAIAYKSGMTTSDVAQAVYDIPGSVWTSITLPSHSPPYSVNFVAANVWGGFDAISYTGTTHLRAIDGGVTWNVAGDDPIPDTGWSCLKKCGCILLALSASSNSSAHGCFDGSWVTTGMPSSHLWKSAAYKDPGSGCGGTIVAVAKGSNQCATGTWNYENNVLTWATHSMPGAATNWDDVTYGAGKFVAIGFDMGISATSSDGASWSGNYSMGDSCSAVTFGNSIFVAVSDTGYSLTSSDGATWVKHPMPNLGTTSWLRVAYGGGIFVAVPYLRNYVATSLDGVNWTLRDSPILADYNSSIAYNNGTFVVACGGMAYSK